jgi:hypothetical protein
MHKLDRTLAHSGGNALDRTVTHVASYLLAGLAQLVIRIDAPGACAHHSNQVAAVFLAELERERFCPVFFEFPLRALKETLPCLPLFAVHTGAWPVARFWRKSFWRVPVCRTAEDGARCPPASVSDKLRIFQNF